MWRSAVQENVAIFLFAPTDNLVVHQGETGTGIQTVQFRNPHFCKKGRLWLPFGVKEM